MPRSPLFIIGAMIAFALVTAALALGFATREPWLGVTLAPGPGGSGVIVAARDPQGPAAALDPGVHLRALRSAEAAPGSGLALSAEDLTEEPDTLADVAAMRAFFARQSAIDAILRAGPVVLVTDRGEITVTPRLPRPLAALPGVFWVQFLVGLAGCMIGGWVLALRRRAEAVFLALTGLGIDLSAHAAGLYSTREIALPGEVFWWASATNTLGALSFGIGMICLFLVYPRRIVPRALVALVIAVFGGWAIASFARLWPGTGMTIHLPVTIEMGLIVAAAVAQIFATRGYPQERAALRWFGLAVLVGAGGFVGLIAAPQAMGLSTGVTQGHAFGSFLIVYIGLAIGVGRYRLFQLEDWSFRILFYAGGVALLLLLDAALIGLVALDQLPAFSLALIVVAFLYLPARDWIGRKLTGTRRIDTEELFDLIAQVALADPAQDQQARFAAMLDRLFQPLEIAPCDGAVSAPAIAEGGEALLLPGFERVPALRLRWARRGRRLFSPRDLNRAETVLAITRQMIAQRNAYAAGAEAERRQITRDMHDNIGVQLLGALHSPAEARKDALIRRALTDLREIVSASESALRPLDDMLADLRAEITEHMVAAQIALDWRAERFDIPAPPPVAGTLRAILREAAGNILRHSRAGRAEVEITRPAPGRIALRVRDDGRGTDPAEGTAPATRGGGLGLVNMRQRAEDCGGRFHFGPGPEGRGCELRAEFDLPATAATGGFALPEAAAAPFAAPAFAAEA